MSYAINDATANEGSVASPGVVTFTVTATAILFQPPDVVHYETVNGTAAAGVDYIAKTGDLTFESAGSQTVTIELIGDAETEPDKAFSLKLSGAGLSFSDDTGVGTIKNDDFILSVSDASIHEGNAGTTNALVQITMSATRTADTTVQYTTTNGSATAGSDYTASAGTATIPANATVTTLNVPVLGDLLYEDDETFTVTVSAPSSPVVIGDGTSVVTISDDDPQPPPGDLPKLSVANVTVSEGPPGTKTASFDVTLTGATTHTVTVTGTTADGTAKAPGDYEAKTDTVVFPPSAGSQTRPFAVTLRGDDLDEANETFTVALSSPSAATLNDAAKTATMTITDDDPTPKVAVADAQSNEGTAVRFTLALDAAAGRSLDVLVSTIEGTAKAPADFTAAANATVTIPAGATTATFDVPTAADAIDELTESFTLRAGIDAVFDEAVGTILDGNATPSLSIADKSVTEGNAGLTQTSVTVTLAPASGQTVTVNYGTSEGTADAPDDFVAANGPLSFAPGETSKTVALSVVGDTTSEDNETFVVTLTGATNASVGDSNATVTITNDDGAFVRAAHITTGAGAGAGSHVRVFDAAGAPQPPDGFFPYRDGPGVRVARGDLDGDGHDELVVAPGRGAPSIVQVYTSSASGVIDQVDAYPGFNGGVYVAVGDVDGDGKAEVITSAGAGGGPHVRTFKLVGNPGSRSLQGAPGFFGARSDFTGGLTVASGDVNGDGIDEIVLGVVSNDQPVVYAWNYNPTTNTPTAHGNPFLAYVPQFIGGISVAAGDLDGDGKAEIVTGAGPGGGPHVRTFSGGGGGLPGSAYAYGADFAGGVNVAVGDVNGDGTNEIITAAGPGGGPHIRTFDLNMSPLSTSFYAYGPNFGGGVFIAGGRD